MPNYDSDSSEDLQNYTTTDVILGYASKESSGDEISHIGGYPIWLDDNIKPPAELSRCKKCNGRLSLLLQLNADLQQHFPNDTRRIYVLSCKNRSCSRKPGTIRAFREVRKPAQTRSVKTVERTTASTQSETKDKGPGLGTILFGGKDTGSTGQDSINPFSSSGSGLAGSSIGGNLFGSSNSNGSGVNAGAGDSTTSSNPVNESARTIAAEEPPTETFAEKLKINADSTTSKGNTISSYVAEAWPDQSAFPNPYQQFYLDAFPEELDPTPSDASTSADMSASKISYEQDDSGGGAREKDTFESTLDKTFQKFSDIIAQNPEQVLRYEFKGQPLLYSSTDGVSSRFVVAHGKVGAVKGMPRCETCGAQRVFELQLMPYLISELEVDEALDIEDGMEWGTVIVGVCGSNCGSNGEVAFREEWIGTQWEERVPRK